MAKVHDHFASPVRVLKRRKEALARLRNSSIPLMKDKRVKTNPRSFEALETERARLNELIAGGGKKAAFAKAWNVNDKDR